MKEHTLLTALTSTMLLLLLCCPLIPTSESATLTLNLMPNKQKYNVGEQVNLVGNLTQDGALVSDALISLEINNPKNELFIIRAFTTGQPLQGPLPVEITSLIPCDAGGNPKYTFIRGDTMGFKVTFKNNMASSCQVIITINMFYNNGVPFKAFIAYNGSIDAGRTITFTIWPILIPSDAQAGTAVAYAAPFNKLPTNGGLAYSPEKNATFNILSTSTIKETVKVNSGKFNITFPLTSIPIMLGNYTAYAVTFYNYRLASATCTFNVMLIGDINNDGTIDGKDISIVCKAFGATPESPRWNPKADLNSDGIIDGKDISIVCKAFGITVIVDP
ncbi:MAG: dockerin type I domain-containing protein [Candidatus Bathyarchaeia archaeon]